MRPRSLVVLCVLVACTTPPASTAHMDGHAFCDLFDMAAIDGAMTCCGAVSPAGSIDALSMACLADLAPLVDDPRTGFDEASARQEIQRFESSLASCIRRPLGGSTLSSLRTVFRGTLAIGTQCSSGVVDVAAALSCRDGYCAAATSSGALPTCTPFAVEGSTCAGDFECSPGLFCQLPGGGGAGACARPQPVGVSCSDDGHCASTYCHAMACAMPATTLPETICDVTPMTTDRDVTLTLVGFETSPTRRVTLRVIDSSSVPIVVFEITGWTSNLGAQHIARAVPSGTSATAQIITVDPSSPTPEMRTWELPVASDGPIDLHVSYDATTMPLSSPPMFSPDTLFDLQTFSFDNEIGRTFEIRLVDDRSGRTVAQARLDAIPEQMFELMIPDGVTSGTRYRIGMFTDVNADDAYEQPPTDHAWRVIATAPSLGGLSIPYMWSTAYQDIGF